MARIRTVKPEFPQSESMGRVSRDARLLFILTWTLCDDAGRTRAASRMLASLLYPYDDDAPKKIDGWLAELEREGCIVRYQAEGGTYLQVCNWLNHQKIDKPSASKIPAFDESSRILANPREVSSEDQGSKDQGSLLGGDPPEWDEIRKAYPKRKGDHRWHKALEAANARVREGSTWSELLAGVSRYAAFVRADGKEFSPYVKQAATFFGKDRAFAEPWTIASKPESDPYARAI
jgi:hypothetical protein